MGSESNNLEFLKEIGLGSTNIGSFINGQWKANGSSVTSVNPSTNQVTIFLTFFL
jgi:aldehyde dehydrogenase family 7 protein A1